MKIKDIKSYNGFAFIFFRFIRLYNESEVDNWKILQQNIHLM